MSRTSRTLSVLLAGAIVFGIGIQANAEMSRKAQIHQMLADIYDRQHDTSNAMIHFSQMVASAPNDPDANYNFAMYLMKQKQFGQAVTYFRKATKQDPSRNEFWAQLGNAQLATKDVNGAIESLNKAGPQYSATLQKAREYQAQMKQYNDYNRQVRLQQQQNQ